MNYLVLWLTVVAIAFVGVSSAHAKPTREQIIELSEKCKNEMRQMNLVEAFGTDFSGMDLSNVDFRGYNYARNDTILTNADFSNSNLQGAKFGCARLNGANFTGANLEGASFLSASLIQATFSNVNLKGTGFYHCDLSGAKLAGVDLSTGGISGSRFRGADLSGAILSGAKSDYWWLDFSSADLTRANLSGLNLNGANFQDSILQNANLSSAQLIQANFFRAQLAGTSFQNANVESATFVALGLSDAERSALESKAQRWKFERRRANDNFRKAMYYPAYGLVVIHVIGLSLSAIWLSRKSKPVVAAAIINLLAFVPATILLLMRLKGASGTVQFNAGNSTAMNLWSMWVSLFPLCIVLLVICVIGAIITTIVFLFTYRQWSSVPRTALFVIYFLLTIGHCLFALHLVGKNFPTA